MHHYPHHIGDFDRATRHLSRLERSIYRDLLDLYYHTEKPIPDDLDFVCRRIIATNEQESTAVQQCLTEFFILGEDGYFNNRCETVIKAYYDNKNNKSKAGKASAKAKRMKAKGNKTSTAAKQKANRKPTDTQQNSTNQNQNQNQNHTVKPCTASAAAKEERSKIWDSYCTAYNSRYHQNPIRNAQVNSQIVQLQKHLGSEAVAVIAFYVGMDDHFFKTRGHNVSTLLANYQAVRTKSLNGGQVATADAQQEWEEKGFIERHTDQSWREGL